MDKNLVIELLRAARQVKRACTALGPPPDGHQLVFRPGSHEAIIRLVKVLDKFGG